MALCGQPNNFAHLRVHDEQLVRLGQLAEPYFVEDPNRLAANWLKDDCVEIAAKQKEA